MSNAPASAKPNEHRIVMLDKDATPPWVSLRPPRFACHWRDYAETLPDQIVERAQDATILLINKVPLTAETLAQLPRLRMIGIAATGTDRVDIKACAARGIVVSNIRGYATKTVPEHTFALILALQRSLLRYRDAVARGRWAETVQFCFFDFPIRDLAGSTLGIVGRGELGSAVAALGHAFGMKILQSGRKGDPSPVAGLTSFTEMLERADVISLHCPLSLETHGLIGREEFALMARCPLLINTARGGLVDEVALIEAVERGQVSGVGFDVATYEPMPADHPLMRIAGRPNVIITPHVAWASREATQALADQLIDNVEAFIEGQPRNVVIPG